jgi:hypothetical protein
VGGEFHEGQLWEEVIGDPVIEEKQAEVMYSYLTERLRARSSENMLPVDMPGSIEEVTVQTWKDGRAGHILFTPTDSLTTPMKKMEVQVFIEYEEGFMKVGMENSYTITMLAWEFQELTQRQWNIYPLNGYRRLLDGTVVHKVTTDFDLFNAARADEELAIPPAKILEERGRGTIIANLVDQGKLLQYWAWLQQPIEVGVLIPADNFKIEYWMPIALQPIPDEEDRLTYVRILKELWLEKLRGISPGVVQKLALLGDDFGFQVRYVFNGLRVWFAPNPTIRSGMNRS